MEPKCHGDDLCTLQELSDSTLLSCIENRYKEGIHHAHVGRNVSLLVTPSPHTIPVHANRLAAAILSDLCTQADDQCLLLYGSEPQDKTAVYQSVLASLLSQTHSSLTSSVMSALQLLSLLTNSEGVLECVLATSLFVNPVSRKSTGAHFSCTLLSTACLQKFKAFTHLDVVGTKLEEVGMSLQLREHYMALISAVRSLLEGEEAGGYLGVQLSSESGLTLAQQLYAYLLAWTVNWLNSELAPPSTETPRRVLCVSHPSKWTDGYRDSLPGFVKRYCSESLYNLFCQRFFVWEQEQYAEEGIEWENIPVEFNQMLMDTYHRADGLLYSVGLDSSERMLTALASCFENSGDTCYETDSDTFVVTHFTGEQSYVLTSSWPTLNTMHSVSHDLTRLLSTSSNQLLRDISKIMMESSPDVLPLDHTPSDHAHSMTSRARACMSALCEEVTTCHPHFVITLGINNGQEDKGLTFDPAHVLSQLQHLRVLDVALIQSCGYPVRLSHDRFVASYSSLLISKDPAQSRRDTCQALIVAAQLDDCIVGTHQVLLKPWHIDQLEDAISVFQTSARKLQQAFRRSYSRRNSDRLRMEKVFNVMRQSNVFESSGEDDSPPSSVASPTRNVRSPDYHMTESDDPLSSGDMHSPTSTIPPNVPASRPHPSLPARPHLSPPQQSPSRASPASPKSPARSGHAGAKKRSWGKDIRQSSSQAAAAPSSLAQEDPTSFSWYHGMISRSQAERAVRSVSCDCFLIRESQNRGGEHSLTLTHKGKVKHFRIDTKPGNKIRYELFGAKRSFLRLSELVEYYSQYCLSADGELLVTPLPKEGNFDDCPPPLPPPRKSNLSSIQRPQKSIRKLHDRPKPVKRSVTKGTLNRVATQTPPLGSEPRPQSVDLFTADISDESISLLQKELDIEERIMEAARRLADMPCNKKEKQRRKQSLVEAHSRLLMLRQQYHTVQERRRFIEMSMQNIAYASPTRRISEPLPPLPPPRGSNRTV